MGNSCWKILQENLAGNSCRKSCGKSCGNSCGKILQENLAGNSCWKILWKNLAGNAVGNSAGNLAGNSVEIPHTYLQTISKVIFKICNSSRSTSFSLVNIKNSFLKPILNRFSHMTTKSKLRTCSTREKQLGDVFLPIRGLKMAKNADVSNFWHVSCHF